MNKILVAITVCVLFQVAFSVDWEITDPLLPQEVIDYFGSREMRYHHFLWHNLREYWLTLDASTQHAISRLGWAPPRPAAFYRDNGDQIFMENNDSGEDFLYMHRQMVKKVNEMVAGTPYGKIKGWTRVPAPGDPKWPVPQPYEVPGDTAFTELVARTKSDDFFFNVIQPMEDELNDEENMRKWTLGQFGSKVEFSVHTWMHLRFSEIYAPIGIRPSPANGNPTPNIDTKYDDVNYRWLGDTYSSHVNPVFWKIHGWVDNKIEQWRKANGLEKIEWKGTWESGPWTVYEDLFAAGDVNDDGDVDPSVSPAEEVVKILLSTGNPDYFRRTSLKSVIP